MSDSNGERPRTCGNCRFFRSDEQQARQGNIGQGMCRREPPKTFAVPAGQGPGGTIQVNFTSLWPAVKVEFDCGEHQFAGELDVSRARDAGV